jgi:hypothetical protein
MRAFSRAFASAAFGQPADVTPAPFLLSSLSPTDANIENSSTQSPARPDAPIATRTPPRENLSQAASPLVGHNTVSMRRWGAIKPIHAIVAVTAVLLLLGAFLLLRPKPVAKPTNMTNPVPAPVLVAPTQPPPAPPPPTVKPEPSPVQPALVEPEPPSGKPAKSAKPASPANRAKRPTSPSPKPKAKRQLIQEL